MKKKPGFPVFLIAILMLSACKTKQVTAESKAEDLARVTYPLQIAFEVEDSSMNASTNSFGHPLRHIKGAGYFLNIHGDRVTAELPHVQLRQIFTDVYERPNIYLEDAEIDMLDYRRYGDPREFTLRFDVLKNAERWQFELHVMPDATAYMKVYSAQRLMTIGYSGKVRIL